MAFESRTTERVRRAARIAEVIEDAAAARVRGEPESDQSLIAAHPELMPELAQELQELSAILRARSRANRTVEDSDSTQLQSLSATLPGYEITRKIRGGAQGVVYEAIQESTGRTVAIKVMNEGPLAGSAERARFDREVRILGQIQHPNIVGIHATGIAAGCRYYVMDFISGLALGGYMAAGKHSIDETLRLFAKICQAVSAAHLRGIIHRDLKPTNIVVDSDNQPHVLDFGLAKFSRSEADVDMSVTQSGQFVGTPAYAAPEQVRLEHDSVDGRTDLYSLGMILFQMLTGGMPYAISRDLRKLSDTIEHTPPQRPSRLNPRIDRELDSIVLKALAKEKANRYQTATAFAADIRRYLAGQSVLAHPPSTLYQLRKLVSRHRLPFAFGVTVLVLVVAFGVVSGIMAFRIADQRDQAQNNLVEAEAQRKIAQKETVEAQRQRTRAEQMTDEAESRTREADWQAYLANLAAADAALRATDTLAARTARRRLDHVLPSLINWEWWHLLRRMDLIENSDGPRDTRMTLDQAPVSCIAFSPDGSRLAAGRRDGVVSVYSSDSLQPLFELSGHLGAVHAIAFDPTGGTFASAGADGTIRFCESRRGGLLRTIPNRAAEVLSIAFEPQTGRLAAGYGDGMVLIWSADDAQAARSIKASRAGLSRVRYAPDGDYLVTAGFDGVTRVWNPRTGEQVGMIRSRNQAVHALAVSPDGALVASGLSDGRLLLAEVDNPARVIDLVGHQEEVTGLSFSPDGTRIVSVSADTTLRLWDVIRREEVLLLRGLGDPLASVAFSPDGAQIATVSADGRILILEAKLSAAEFVRQLANDLSAAEIIELLEADDALEGPLRDTALRIARRLNADRPATHSTNP